MDDEKRKILLKNPEVVKEIHLHLWFESEKAGRDLKFEWAAEDWLKRFSRAWMDYHILKAK